MSQLAEELLSLTRQPANKSLSGVVSQLHAAITAIGSADRVVWLSIRGGTEDFMAENEDLPDSLLWRPQPADSTRYHLDDRQCWELSGDAVTVALNLTTISPGIAQHSSAGIEGKTLLERMADAISGHLSPAAGVTFLWADSLIQPPNHIIVLLSLEDDVYAVIVGLNLAGETVVAIVGQQPFETMLTKHETYPPEQTAYCEKHLTIDEAMLTGLSRPEASWWDHLVQDQANTLLRASWLQLAMKEPLSIASPFETPDWAGISLLPLPPASEVQ